MATSRQKKIDATQALANKLRRMKVVVMASLDGLRVKDSNELRSQLRGAGVEFVVAKKTIIKRALSEVSLAHINLDSINKSFALAFGYEDEVTPAKLLEQFAKTHEGMEWYGGILDTVFVDGGRIKQLASLPSRPQLQANVVRTIAAPLSGMVTLLAGNMRRVVYLIAAIRNKQAPLPETV